MAESASPPALTLAQKLNTLFDSVRDERGHEYSNERVAAAIGTSGSYVGYLRKGERDNPTKATLEALARFFGVAPAYFFDDDAAGRIVDQLTQMRLLLRLRDAGVRRVAMRLGGLSPASLHAVEAMVDQLRQLERLPAEPENDDPTDAPAEPGDA
jgi:transcriptional regulator with XRE-family HTH domain